VTGARAGAGFDRLADGDDHVDGMMREADVNPNTKQTAARVVDRAAMPLAWTMWVLAALAVVATIVLAFAEVQSDFSSDSLVDVFLPLTSLAVPTIGVLIVVRRPGNPIGWVFCVIGLVDCVGLLGEFYADYATQVETLPGWEWMAWLGNWATGPPIFLALSLVFLLFPTGRLLSRRWRPLAWITIAVIAAVIVDGTVGTESVWDEPPTANPVRVSIVGQLFDLIGAGLIILALVVVLGSALSLVVRFRRSRGIERQQLKWFTYAVVIVVALFLVSGVLASVDPEHEGGIIGAISWFTALFGLTIGLPMAIGIAVLRYRLWDIDVIIRRTLIYGVLSASLVLTYVAVVFVLERAVQWLTGESSQLATAVSTLAVAALFHPLRGRIQAIVDRRFYRQKYDAARTIEAFSAHLRDEVDLDTLATELRAVVQQTMQPAHVSLWLRDSVRPPAAS
jgi:hypothetical protein